jgi:branched-chain amino acid transport system ATP-binding protein
MDLMMSVCDSITVLDFGKVIATGTPRQVQDNPAVTAAYLGATGDGAAAEADRDGAAAAEADRDGAAAAEADRDGAAADE